MRKVLVGLVLIAALGGAAYYVYGRADATQAAGAPRQGPGGGGPGGGGGFGFGQGRPPMTVELTPASRAHLIERTLVVGNLIGALTVDVAPRVAGRLMVVNVRLGDRVTKGQVLAQIEDQEIKEQVKQAEASFDVSRATIRQREADLALAQTSLERSRNLFDRQLLPKQTLDDAEARQQAAAAQLDLARAQFNQAKARLDELQITLANTSITSPVDGFVGKRNLDPGSFVGTNAAIVAVVDIHFVRLVANIVEKDLRRVSPGGQAEVEVDAYPGETFKGRVARVAPVLDPATRTAAIEIEIDNPSYRLRPGMYARVNLTIGERTNALVVPRAAVVDIDGKRGVFVVADGAARESKMAKFLPLEVGLQDQGKNLVEVAGDITDGVRVVTTGATSLRDGDPVLLAAQRGPGRRAIKAAQTPAAREGGLAAARVHDRMMRGRAMPLANRAALNAERPRIDGS